MEEFNRCYGTSLVENQDIIRIPYGGIHEKDKRGHLLGKDKDSVIISAWSNAHTDEIEKGNPNKQAIQYRYPGVGRECENIGVAKATPGTVTPDQIPPKRVHVKE